MRWLRHHAVTIFGSLAVLYLLVPIAVIAIFSFNDPEGKFNYSWSGFTLDHWTGAFSIPSLNDALVTSLQLAALSTVIATILGTMIALALVRHEFFGRRVSNFLIVVPMATPEVVIGAALLSLFVSYNVALGFTTLLIAHVMFSISFVVIVVRSRLIGFDRRLEEAARDLGASAATTFRTVTLPLIMPGVIGAALLAFALSIDDFVISNFNSGQTETFPLYIFGAAQRGIPVEVYTLATILFVVTVAAMMLVIWQQSRAERLAAVREDSDDPYAGTPAVPPAPGAAGG
jgi:spermidine/putrescine transport system permease protein